MSKSPADSEVETLSTRAISFVLIVMTVLLSSCWLLTQAPQFQAGSFLSGIASVLTWLSYCQQKTSAELEQIRIRK